MIRKYLVIPIGLTLLVGVNSQLLQASEDKRPNIVLIMADDMGFSDLGCYGGEIVTPHLDKLARNGLRFSNFYNGGRCCPTRASLLTGLFPHQTGIGHMTNSPRGPKAMDKGVYGYRGFLNRDCATLAELLREAGYHTYMAGKWHVGYHQKDRWPLQRGFEQYYGIISGACSYFRPQGDRGLTFGNKHVEVKGKNFYTTDAFTDHAIQFVKEQKDDQPFFLYVAYNAPHWPLHAKKADIQKFVGKYREGWDVLRKKRHERQLKMKLFKKHWKLSPRDPKAPAWNTLTEKQKTELDYRMAVYAAQVHCMDYNIGRLVSTLEESGKLDNTLIVFLSDNGGCAEGGILGGGDFSNINNPELWGAISYGLVWANLSNVPFRLYKVRVHAGGTCTPLIIHWPARMPQERKGSITHEPGYLLDIMPTALEVAKAKYPTKFKGNKLHPLEGKSLVPIIDEGKRKGHEWMFWEHSGNCAVIHGKWKAIARFGKFDWELYDLETDRTELHNLAQKHPSVVRMLEKGWMNWARTHHVIPRGKKQQKKIGKN